MVVLFVVDRVVGPRLVVVVVVVVVVVASASEISTVSKLCSKIDFIVSLLIGATLRPSKRV